MPSKYSNRQKENSQLGMPFTTASLRLHRLIMFMLAKECNKSLCFQCGKEIKTVAEFSIEHKKPWLDIDPNLFWDLSNIAFSHTVCNKRAGRKPIKWSDAAREGFRSKSLEARKTGPDGTAWCGSCRIFEPIGNFWKCSSRWNGVQKRCKKACRKADRRNINYYEEQFGCLDVREGPIPSR